MIIRDFIWNYFIIACTSEPDTATFIRTIFTPVLNNPEFEVEFDMDNINMLADKLVEPLENIWGDAIVESSGKYVDVTNTFKRLKNTVKLDLDTAAKRLADL